jgi:phosphosulfolactate phosphohydrolase-like enzyme
VTSVSLSRERWQLTATAAARKLSGGERKLAQFGLQDDLDWALSGAVTYVTPIGLIVQAGLTHQRDQGTRINQGVFRIAYQAGF